MTEYTEFPYEDEPATEQALRDRVAELESQLAGQATEPPKPVAEATAPESDRQEQVNAALAKLGEATTHDEHRAALAEYNALVAPAAQGRVLPSKEDLAATFKAAGEASSKEAYYAELRKGGIVVGGFTR